MAKVYLLTAGDYSDYRVVGAFSSQERLEAAIKSCDRNHYHPVEEYELDEIAEDGIGPVFGTALALTSGESLQAYENSPQQRVANGPCKVRINFWGYPKHFDCVIVESPISAEHAHKVAVEKRQEWLRTGEIVGATDARVKLSPAPH